MKVRKAFLGALVAGSTAFHASQAPGQAAPPTEVAQGIARVEAYRPGVTTLGQFLNDGWRAGDIARGKLGILAWRSEEEGATAGFILATCPDVQDPELGQLLDMISKHQSLASEDPGKFSSQDFHWPNGLGISNKDGTTLRCPGIYQLTFENKVLKSREKLPSAP